MLTMLRSRIRTKAMKMSNTLIVAHKLYCLFNIITHFVPDLDSNQENNQGKRKLKKENTDKERSYLKVPEKGRGKKWTQSVKAAKKQETQSTGICVPAEPRRAPVSEEL